MIDTRYPIATPLLGWFAAARRRLPFREDPAPYHIWVSEIMLQQTRMTTVLPYYQRFMEALPDIPALAECDPERLHKLWEGLGYYSRVRNMQKAAQILCREYGGELPRSYEALLTLPGIGTYTAGAIASISYGIPVPAVDGNVIRVFARLYNDHRDSSTPAFREEITALAGELQPPDAAGDFNQALMELGALVCTPGVPDCVHCPLRDFCAGWQTLGEKVANLPVKSPKKERKKSRITVLLVRSPKGVLVMKRPASGLLAGMWQPFLAEEDIPVEQMTERVEALGVRCRITGTLPTAKHVFTHVEWTLGGWLADSVEPIPLPEGYGWMDEMENCPVPSAFRFCKPYMYHTERTME